jgi:hypothetical protein
MNRYVGNLPPMPGVFPDYPAPVLRNAGAERELTVGNSAATELHRCVPRRASQTEAGSSRRIVDSLTSLADAFNLLIDLRIFCSDLGVTWH